MAIRNAFQKIKVGDRVYWRGFQCTKSGVVTAKEKGGALAVDVNAKAFGVQLNEEQVEFRAQDSVKSAFVIGADVIAIERNGEMIHQ